ncbi:MAG: tRNA epoxyqueuosine(34) reductase QueG [bacterium]
MITSDPPTHGAPPPLDAEAVVKETALAVGFSAVGITDVNPTPQSERVFDRWIAEGKYGDMHYLARGADKRHAPGILLDGARSVICVGLDYYSRSNEKRNAEAPGEGRGAVAIYAHGRDYHVVLRAMLAELDRRLARIFPGMMSRIAVDTQPISERDLAIKSGIAWLGKNTCVISPDHGSWMFLGELITDLSLRSDGPLETLCGSCTACMDACPTGALGEPYLMDANKCISYLTIEKRGEIPKRFHNAVGANLFGCDACQTACPFNTNAGESILFGAANRNPIVEMPVTRLIGIGEEEFKALTRESPISRCKAAGIRRNAAIIASNLSRRT